MYKVILSTVVCNSQSLIVSYVFSSKGSGLIDYGIMDVFVLGMLITVTPKSQISVAQHSGNLLVSQVKSKMGAPMRELTQGSRLLSARSSTLFRL